MSNDAKDALSFGASAILVTVAIFIACWTAGMALGAIGNWWGGLVKSWEPKPLTEEQKAEAKKQDEKWQNDPTDYRYLYKKCVDSGGFPGNDGWGNVQCHGKE